MQRIESQSIQGPRLYQQKYQQQQESQRMGKRALAIINGSCHPIREQLYLELK
jgi:hypothetical protein